MPIGFDKDTNAWYEYNEKGYRKLKPGEYGRIKAAEQMGPGEAAMVRAGAAANNALNFFGGGTDQVSTEEVSKAHPWASLAGDAIPYIGGGAIGGARIGGQMLAEGVTGFLTNPGDNWDRLKSGLIESGAAGVFGMTGRLLSNLARSRRIPASKAAQDILDTGGKVTPGQRVGVVKNELLKKEAAMSRQAWPAKGIERIEDHNIRNTSQLITDSIFGKGVRNGPMDAGAVEDATRMLRSQMDSVGAQMGDSVTLPKAIVEDMGALFGKEMRGLKQFADLPKDFSFTKNVGDNVVYKDSVTMTGRQLMKLREITTQGLGDATKPIKRSEFGQALGRIDDKIDDTIGELSAMDYKQVRERYEVLQSLKGIMSSEGTVTKKQPFNKLRAQLGDRLLMNADELNPETQKLIKNLSGISAPSTAPIPSSGTAEALLGTSQLNPLEMAKGAAAGLYMGTSELPFLNLPGALNRGLLGGGLDKQIGSIIGATAADNYVEQR